MDCQQGPQISFAAIFFGAVRLAITLPLLVWLFPKLPIVRDTYEFITETLPDLFRLLFFR